LRLVDYSRRQRSSN